MSARRTLMRSLATALWPYRKQRPRRGTRILMYHAVGTQLVNDTYGISISKDNFRAQLELLKSDPHIKVTSLSSLGRDSAIAEVSVAITFDDGYLDNLTTAAPLLAEYGIPFTVFVTSDHLDRGHPVYLTETDLRELAEVPSATIGAHGKSHRRLDGCPDHELRLELAESRERLQDVIGRDVLALSYPHGAVDHRVIDAAIGAGYQQGFSSRFDINRSDRDPMCLCRSEIWADDDPVSFHQKLHGAWDWYRFRHRDPARQTASHQS